MRVCFRPPYLARDWRCLCDAHLGLGHLYPRLVVVSFQIYITTFLPLISPLWARAPLSFIVASCPSCVLLVFVAARCAQEEQPDGA